jgi:hypothetical protein
MLLKIIGENNESKFCFKIVTEKNEILALITDKKISFRIYKELDKNLLSKINHAVNNENFEFNKFSST